MPATENSFFAEGMKNRISRFSLPDTETGLTFFYNQGTNLINNNIENKIYFSVIFVFVNSVLGFFFNSFQV